MCILIYWSYTHVPYEYVHLGISNACLKLLSVNTFSIKHASHLVFLDWVMDLSFNLLYKLEIGINFQIYNTYNRYQVILVFLAYYIF